MDIQLTPAELDLLRSKVDADLLTYLGHKTAGSGLFPKEEAKLNDLQALSDKLKAAAEVPQLIEPAFAKLFVSHGRQLLVYFEVEAGTRTIFHEIAHMDNFFGEAKQTFDADEDHPDFTDTSCLELGQKWFAEYDQAAANKRMAQFIEIDAKMGKEVHNG